MPKPPPKHTGLIKNSPSKYQLEEVTSYEKAEGGYCLSPFSVRSRLSGQLSWNKSGGITTQCSYILG